MTNMRLFKNGQKERETFKLITRVDTVDPELKKKTLERMLELKKELEAEKKRKAEARKRAARRGFAVAAIVALVIAVTPLRGYVASAAEAVSEWIEQMINPLYDYDETYDPPEAARSGEIILKNQEIITDDIILDECDYENYPIKIKSSIVSDDFEITLDNMDLLDFSQYAELNDYHDIVIGTTLKITDENIINAESWDFNPSSTIELVFEKNNKDLFKSEFSFSQYNWESNENDNLNNIIIINGELNFDNFVWPEDESIFWYDSDFYINDHSVMLLSDILKIYKPDKIKIASVSVIFNLYSDWITVTSKDEVNKYKENEYIVWGYDEREEEYTEYYMCKVQVLIFKGYNSEYYDVEKETKRNQKALDVFYNQLNESSSE